MTAAHEVVLRVRNEVFTDAANEGLIERSARERKLMVFDAHAQAILVDRIRDRVGGEATERHVHTKGGLHPAVRYMVGYDLDYRSVVAKRGEVGVPGVHEAALRDGSFVEVGAHA